MGSYNWEGKIQSMPFDEDTKLSLIRQIKDKYPDGISETGFYMQILEQTELKRLFSHVTSGLFPDTSVADFWRLLK